MWEHGTEQDDSPGQPDTNPRPLTKTGLKARGWTDTMIRELLGEPDERRPNPRHPERADLCLYLLERVEDAERTDAFFERLKRSEKRKDAGTKAGAKAVQTRLAQVTGQVEGLETPGSEMS